MTSYEYAVAATQGARDYQEDTALFWPNGEDAPPRAATDDGSWCGAIAVLADGMGGHKGGALASRTVCDMFLVAATSRAGGSVYERLQGALTAANDALAAKVSDNPQLSGMGSTLIGVAFTDHGLEWISVGDSPLYLFRRGEVAVLNADHSMAPELDRLVAAGRLTPAQARRDPRRHMLRSAVTGEEIDMIDISQRPLALETGDYVVLASDGVESLDVSEIGRIIQGYAGDGPQAVARALIRAVENLREPHQDNATVIVVRPRPPN